MQSPSSIIAPAFAVAVVRFRVCHKRCQKMITYRSDGFGVKTLFVWHGSAVFRAFLPASFSTGLLVLNQRFLSGYFEDRSTITHPYAISVFIAILGFLLVFRLNYSYHRVRTCQSDQYLSMLLLKLLSNLNSLHLIHSTGRQRHKYI